MYLKCVNVSTVKGSQAGFPHTFALSASLPAVFDSLDDIPTAPNTVSQLSTPSAAKQTWTYVFSSPALTTKAKVLKKDNCGDEHNNETDGAHSGHIRTTDELLWCQQCHWKEGTEWLTVNTHAPTSCVSWFPTQTPSAWGLLLHAEVCGYHPHLLSPCSETVLCGPCYSGDSPEP